MRTSRPVLDGSSSFVTVASSRTRDERQRTARCSRAPPLARRSIPARGSPRPVWRCWGRCCSSSVIRCARMTSGAVGNVPLDWKGRSLTATGCPHRRWGWDAAGRPASPPRSPLRRSLPRPTAPRRARSGPEGSLLAVPRSYLASFKTFRLLQGICAPARSCSTSSLQQRCTRGSATRSP
jgi:hypothetical protein